MRRKNTKKVPQADNAGQVEKSIVSAEITESAETTDDATETELLRDDATKSTTARTDLTEFVSKKKYAYFLKVEPFADWVLYTLKTPDKVNEFCLALSKIFPDAKALNEFMPWKTSQKTLFIDAWYQARLKDYLSEGFDTLAARRNAVLPLWSVHAVIKKWYVAQIDLDQIYNPSDHRRTAPCEIEKGDYLLLLQKLPLIFRLEMLLQLSMAGCNNVDLADHDDGIRLNDISDQDKKANSLLLEKERIKTMKRGELLKCPVPRSVYNELVKYCEAHKIPSHQVIFEYKKPGSITEGYKYHAELNKIKVVDEPNLRRLMGTLLKEALIKVDNYWHPLGVMTDRFALFNIWRGAKLSNSEFAYIKNNPTHLLKVADIVFEYFGITSREELAASIERKETAWQAMFAEQRKLVEEIKANFQGQIDGMRKDMILRTSFGGPAPMEPVEQKRKEKKSESTSPAKATV